MNPVKEKLSFSHGARIGILGFAREGKSVLKFLQNRRLTQMSTRINADDEIWIVDKKATIKAPRGIHGQFGKNYLKNLGRFDLIFRSPGIPWNTPELVRARRAGVHPHTQRGLVLKNKNPRSGVGVKFSSATKLFFEQLRGLTQTERGQAQTKQSGPTVIGITGTKGKGTTATLLYNILHAAHKPVFLAGNIGAPALDLLPRLSALSPRKSAIVILELSSFQLQDLRVSPHVAAILDVFPDHQDAHKNLHEYYEAKANIARYQKPSDKVFFFGDNHLSARIAQRGHGKKVAVYPFSNSRELENGVRNVLQIPGEHNFKNAVMAATVAKSLGIPKATIIKTVKNFRGLEHRLEFVRRIRVKPRSYPRRSASVEFWNDSASTNPQTAAAAVKTFSSPPYNLKPLTSNLILIAGGQDKNLDYAPLANALRHSNTKLIVLFGENRKKIRRQVSSIKCQVIMVKNLPQAIKTAYRFAQKLTTYYLLPTTILFSPGAASFDQFHDYADRGTRFKNIVKSLTK
ncbi:MAG: UDP-N-acetylmuramoylalanine--D-glutamate ligase [Candidatus Liptonbacteria bacterium RIFCSPLOWO2_01_FULL_52_25]|uniref:UDP-N-acetylmuramoylalanine--D-glutamate ligase n=1 Tax=Candidatus Liptonbacteria bacterium RIFCSPLOWO2_01_FULL_52_25 TaxID=1798650 RepID=A0A1G2CC74_9BACT|nr:MAG: UDP-N-acetylmuramoylalanine--D-glutamate ligase [Candidatus Liptonbacteria bacterium RIFCSPLOWO2_01_FULL_52_25]